MSHVDHVTGEAVEAFLQSLRQRRVRVHVPGRFESREIPLLRERELGQKLRDIRADEVSTEELQVLDDAVAAVLRGRGQPAP